ncbi:flagellar biosynthesis protein FliQ [Anaplasmataceae bacterium AB001_6]|nr:flagellar biosynthesis protein FliQ [Anaplasmataceae bacterium AB001_6]
MDNLDVLLISKEAIWVLIKISTPVILTSMSVGLIISIFQTLTQINEVTLTFVPKIVAVFFSILFSIAFIAGSLHDFANYIMEAIHSL